MNVMRFWFEFTLCFTGLKPNIQYIKSACAEIGQNMRRKSFICLEYTTYTQTTENFMPQIIENELGLKEWTDFWLALSPDKVNPGNKQYGTFKTPKVLGVISNERLKIGEAI